MFGKKYTYSDPFFLNKLIMIIVEKSSEISATLMPDVQEFIENAERRNWGYSTSSIPEVEEMLRGKQLSTEQIHYLIMMTLCQKHNILPFFSLEFDYDKLMQKI